MKEIKRFIPLAGVLVLCLGAFRITELSQNAKVPVFNYFNIANLLAYTFDVVHGLLYFAAPIVVYVIFKDAFQSPRWTHRKQLFLIVLRRIVDLSVPMWFRIKRIIWRKRLRNALFFSLISLSIGRFFYLYYCHANSYDKVESMLLKLFAEVILISIVALFKRVFTIDSTLLSYTAIVCFLVAYMKINAKFEIYASGPPLAQGKVVIIFKKGKTKPLDNANIINNTPDFVFLKRGDTTLVIPMAEIHTIEYIDTTKDKILIPTVSPSCCK